MSCAASALTSYGSPELLQRQNDPSQQSSALDAVYRFLRSSSTPPTATSASTASATNPMMLRSTRLRQRGCTLVASLITIHSCRSIRAILVQRKNIAIGNFPIALYYSIIHAMHFVESNEAKHPPGPTFQNPMHENKTKCISGRITC